MLSSPSIEPTNREILDAVVSLGEAIQGLATYVDERFNRVDKQFNRVDERFNGVDQQAGRLATDIISIKSTMVTKIYLDDRLADLRGDLITLARKQNRKLETVIEEFVSQGLLTRAAADRLLALEPFPQ